MATKSRSTSSFSSRTSTPKLSSAGTKPRDNVTVSVRKIANGHIVSHSGTVGKGRNVRYVTHETYSATNPIKLSTKKG